MDGKRTVSRIVVKQLINCASDRDDPMSKVPEEVQDSKDLVNSQDEMPGQVGSSPDIVLEHGSTRLSLDLDGWEWFWLFLAICFIGSLWLFFST